MTLVLDTPRHCVAAKLLSVWLTQPDITELFRINLERVMRSESERHDERELGRSLSAQQLTNLMRLARGLLALPEYAPQFSMRTFRSEPGETQTTLISSTPAAPYATAEPPCGTVACAVGYAPAILNVPMPEFTEYAWKMNQGWMEFSYRTLGSLPSGLWEWCFDGSWRGIDNTPHGAAARIVHMILRAPDLPYELNPEDESDTTPWEADEHAAESYAYLLAKPEYAR